MPGRAHTTFGHVRATGALLVVLLGAGAGCTTRSGAPGAGGATPPSAPVPATQVPGATPAGVPASPVPLPVAVPARLAAASPAADAVSSQCLAEIEAFAEQHTGNRVMLGQAAFADSDRLVLTRMPQRGSDGRPLDGRAGLPQPVVLNLLAGAEGCSVRLADGAGDASTGTSSTGASSTGASLPAPLPACHCVPLAR